MKHQVTIKQMVRNANKWFIILVVFLLPLLSIAQNKKDLSREQYKVIEDAFKNSGKDHTRIFFQTIDYKSWVHLFYGSYYRNEHGIGLCSFKDPKLKETIDQLIQYVMNIRVKELNQTKLGNRYILIQDLTEYPYLSITEPIILGDYSFILWKYQNQEG